MLPRAPGISRVAGSAAWGGGRAACPKSKPSRFPQRHVRLLSLWASETRRKYSDPLVASLICSRGERKPQSRPSHGRGLLVCYRTLALGEKF